MTSFIEKYQQSMQYRIETTKYVGSNYVHGNVYSITYYAVTKTWNTIHIHEIALILLRVPLNTSNDNFLRIKILNITLLI